MNNGKTMARVEGYSGLRLVTAGLALALALVGCHRPSPRTVPEMPALEVPPAPPRNVEPTDAQALPPVPLVDVPARTVERPRVPAPVPPRDASRPDVRPDPSPEPAKVPEDPRQGTTLQTTTANQEGEVDRRIRTLLQAAATDLARIDYRRLNPDAQAQYDTVKSLIRQSEEALKAKNLSFAQTTAEKAATLANQLSGR